MLADSRASERQRASQARGYAQASACSLLNIVGDFIVSQDQACVVLMAPFYQKHKTELDELKRKFQNGKVKWVVNSAPIVSMELLEKNGLILENRLLKYRYVSGMNDIHEFLRGYKIPF